MPEVQHCARNTIDPEHKENNLSTSNESRSLPFPPPLSSLRVRKNNHLGANGLILWGVDIGGQLQDTEKTLGEMLNNEGRLQEPDW